MYHYIVKKMVRRGFVQLSAGDYHPALGLMSPQCHYYFVGQHALGGRRSNRELIAKWFERFLRVLPGFQFNPVEVVVKGWPWRTTVVVKLEVSWKRPDGGVYENVALQMVKLEWGKAVEILTVDDSKAFAALLDDVARNFGVEEAAAAPIEG